MRIVQSTARRAARACRGRLMYLAVAVAAVACDRPVGLAGDRFAPRPIAESKLTLDEFVPVGQWLWDGPTECSWVIDLSTEEGRRARAEGPLRQSNDGNAVYIVVLSAPSKAKFLASLWLEFDRNRELLIYHEHRGGSYYPDTPLPWRSTSVQIGTRSSAWGTPAASVANYFFRPKAPTEIVYADADSIYHLPAFGASGRLIRLALERCGLAGKGFTSPFDRPR